MVPSRLKFFGSALIGWMIANSRYHHLRSKFPQLSYSRPSELKPVFSHFLFLSVRHPERAFKSTQRLSG